MTLPYYDLKEKTIELAKLTEDNINIGVSSTLIKIKPAFILPDNTIFYITTDHYSANFFEEIEYTFEVIRKNSRLSLDEESEFARLQKQYNNLINDYRRFKNNEISAGDVRNYLNMNCLEIFKYNSSLQNLYSKECQKVLLMLLKSKIQIYDYFLKLLNNNRNIIDSFNNYPNKYSCSNYNQIIRNATKYNPDNNYKQIIKNQIINFCKEEMQYECNFLTRETFMQDFSVQTIGIDKIETQFSKTITTTKSNLYEFYFNYLIMGYNIVRIPKIIYNQKTNTFEFEEESLIVEYQDEKYKEEIELIKKKVPLEKRCKYLI